MTKAQSKSSGVVPFTEDLPISWTKGVSFDGSEIYIPSDIVYYGQKTSENKIYIGHSSGIAAYSDSEEAQKRALTELIERDALMRNWYSRKSPDIVNEEILPIHIRKRIRHWAKQNRKLAILQLPSDYGWVFESIIIGNEYPFFVSGAAATIDPDLVENTIIKALQEAEYNLLLTLKNPKKSEISPQEVSTPSDHGLVYYFQYNAKTISWLWKGVVEETFKNPKYFGYKKLLYVLETSTVDLSESNSTLKVVRVFSPKLVPINFGFNSAHYTHPSLEGKIHPDSLKMPHYFA